MRICLALMLVACAAPSIATPPDASGGDELLGWTVGARGQAGFVLEFGDPSRPIAQRARAHVAGVVRSAAPRLAAVTTDDPSILAIENLVHDSQLIFRADLKSAGAGDTDVVLRDAAGTEIDRMTFHVRPSDVLDLNRAWGAGDALILGGEVERMHVTTMTAGVVTAGAGAVQFTLAGALSPVGRDQAPWLYSEGDEVFFRAAASGTGTITAVAPEATTTVTVSMVSTSALTALTANPSALDVPANRNGVVAVGALAGGAPVFGARCTWSNAAPLTIALNSVVGDLSGIGEQTGFIGSGPAFLYSVSGPPGAYSPTCTIGALATTISVHVR